MARLTLAPKHLRLIQDILAEHLSPGTGVWVFGSRATDPAWRYTDLDLAIDAGRRLTIDERAILAEAFSESDLPYRVDVVDRQSIDECFRGIIAAQRLPLSAS